MSDPYLPQGTTTTQSGLSDNVAAGLGYLIWIIAVVWLFVEPYKTRPFVRFASFQTLFMLVANIVCGVVLGIISAIPGLHTIGAILTGLVFLALGICYLIAMVMAFLGKKFVIPVVGPLAAKYSGTSTI